MVRRNWRRLGVVILVAGLISAAVIFLHARSHDDGDADNDALNKLETYQAEKIGGQANVIAIEMNVWLASWWHGERLAGTVALLSLGASGFCFWCSKRSPTT